MNVDEYIKAHEEYFWTWKDHGEVLEIPGGSTIAYRSLVTELLLAIGAQGLPPFGSLLLAIIATNNNAQAGIARIENLLGNKMVKNFQFTTDNASAFSEALMFLGTLCSLPLKYKSGKGRQALFQTIFASCHNKVSVQRSKSIVRSFKDGLLPGEKLNKLYPFNIGIYIRDFKTIALLGRRFPNEKAIISSIADLPEIDIEDEVLEDALPVDFFTELTNNPHTFQIGRLIKPIWAGFKIPIDMAVPSQQQFGGISDLTNKGDFDKLLVSEFANDDLTFLSRLANNEALYLHREIPPAVDSCQRMLLIDTSMMTWGTPKVLAYASAIAVAKHPKAKAQSLAFAVGKTYTPLSFDNIDVIIDGLQIADTGLHPAAGISLLLKEKTLDKNAEIFLFLSEEALRQHSILRVLSDYINLFKYIVTVNSSGCISFYRYSKTGRKLIQHIELDLDRLWHKEVKGPVNKTYLQADIEESNYPILFATPHNIKTVLKVDDSTFCIADNKLFLQHEQGKLRKNRGYLILLNKLPSNGSFATGSSSNGDTLFLTFNPQNKELSVVNLSSRKKGVVLFKQWKAVSVDFFFHNGSFYHLNNSASYKIDFDNGRLAVEVLLQNTKDLRRLCTEEENRLRKLKHTQSKKAILKNITHVFINNTDNLVFNQHELRLNASLFEMKSSGFVQPVIEAVRMKAHNVFEFADSSTITVNPSGMIILKSSNADIPAIYVPSVLAASLGLATTEYFAGNDYYLRTMENEDALEEYGVTLKHVGSAKLDVVRILREELNFNLSDGKRIVDAAVDTVIVERADRHKAMSIVNLLTQAGAKAEMHAAAPGKRLPIKIINVAEFNKIYLQAFIKNIQQHAAIG